MKLPYLELPVAIGYAAIEGEEPKEKVVIGKFQPIEISHYHEGFYDVGMFIYINGQATQIALTIQEFEGRIKSYWTLLSAKQNVKSKLGIVQ